MIILNNILFISIKLFFKRNSQMLSTWPKNNCDRQQSLDVSYGEVNVLRQASIKYEFLTEMYILQHKFSTFYLAF